MLNYIIKYWRGEVTLAKSFWLVFIGLGIAFAVTFFLFAILSNALIKDDQLIYKIMIIVSTFHLVTFYLLMPWQIVGLWRSSQRHINIVGKPLWGRLAQIIIVISLGWHVCNIQADYNELQLYYKMGFSDNNENDELFGINRQKQYSVVVNKNKKTLRIEGVFQKGISEEVDKALKKSPSIKIVHLESPGGSKLEGEEIAKLIIKNKLDTISYEECVSACTEAFLAGKNRTLAKNAVLGFHKIEVEGLETNKIINEMAEEDVINQFFPFCREQGISEDFINAFTQKVLKSTGNEMWYPSPAEMLKMGLVHKIV